MPATIDLIRNGSLRLESIHLQFEGEEPVAVELGQDQLTLVDLPKGLESADLGDLLTRILYSDETPSQLVSAALTFRGPKGQVTTASRDWVTRQTRLTYPGQSAQTCHQSLGHEILGLNREAFEKRYRLDDREQPGKDDAADPKSLGRRLRAELPKVNSNELDLDVLLEEKSAISDRRSQVEAALKTLKEESGGDHVEPIDPPAVGELLESLNQAREIDARLLRRRIQLLDDMGRKLAPTRSDSRLPVAALLSGIETLAGQLENAESQYERLRQHTRRRGDGFIGMAVATATCTAGLALFAFGLWLFSQALAEFGLAVASIAAIASLIGAGLRGLGLFRRAKALTIARRKLTDLREEGLKRIARVGAPADLDEIDSTSLRRVVDRVATREAGKEVAEWLAPYRDDPREKAQLEQLLVNLERPLGQTTRSSGGGTPEVPLIRATHAALAIAGQWTKALVSNRENLAEQVEAEIRRDVEIDLMSRTLRQLKNAERELDRRVGAAERQTASADAVAPEAALAAQLNESLIPTLQGIMAERAPLRFDGLLNPVYETRPSASTNALVYAVHRLESALTVDGAFARIYVDPGINLSETDEDLLFRYLADEVGCGPIVVSFRRRRDREAFLEKSKPVALWRSITEGHTTLPCSPELMELAEPAAMMSPLRHIDHFVL
ncbi:MAG: hypothetical protein V3W41_10920 [Planctomycetota bacterium]